MCRAAVALAIRAGSPEPSGQWFFAVPAGGVSRFTAIFF
jgi:hypothetical protein